MSNTIFNTADYKKFEKIFKNLDADDEFEIMFGGYYKTNQNNMKTFLDILKFMKYYNQENKFKIEQTNTLDISYNYDKNNYHTYRLSINGIERINELMAIMNNRKNHVIFSLLVANILNDSDKDLTIINKLKDFDKSYTIDEYDIKIRLAKEQNVDKKTLETLIQLENVDVNSILFRFKNRFSLIVESNNKVETRIDLTSVKSSNNVNTLNHAPYNYEIEIDFNKKKKINDKTYISKLMNLIKLVKCVISQSNNLVPKSEKEQVINKYNELIYGINTSSEEPIKIKKNAYGMASQSLEVVHLVDYLPNNYSVSDKADGDRHLGIVVDGTLYLLSSNLDVVNTGLSVKKKYNDTIVDGEYIFLTSSGKYLYTCFDILFHSGNDIRKTNKLEERFEMLDEFLISSFDTFKFETYNGEFNLNKIHEFEEKQITDYWNFTNNKINTSNDTNIISRKYFMFVKGGVDSEIFDYSTFMWNLWTKKMNIPYMLDGLIYTPLDQIYTQNLKETKYRIYKWKPPTQNSIDFFVKFEKNYETGEILNVYDDTNEDNLQGKLYKIINLHNGKTNSGIEVPVLFRKPEQLYIAKIFTDDNGNVRDEEGNIILDNTVVEFYYNDDPDIPFGFKWTPMRTRYDKTESVMKFKKKYGNPEIIANKIWSSIKQDIQMKDITLLSNNETYDNHINELKKRIDASIIAIEKQQDVYYQKTTKLASSMRDFHNYIKSNMIFEYCSPKRINNKMKKMIVLDYGCGRGGDILKFFHAKIDYVVGFDYSIDGINSSTDGAISRYNNQRSKKPNFPKMNFIHADGGALLNYENQLSALGKMSSNNEKLLKQFFGENNNTKFDVINCQLMIHFMFKNDTTWNNFCQNVNNLLVNDGYLLITTLDGDLIDQDFNNGNITEYYNEDGQKKKFFEYIKTYSDTDISKTGLSYNAFVTLFKDNENSYDTEYIVKKQFLIDQLKEKCNMELIETELFTEIFDKQMLFFKDVAPHEENESSKQFFMKVAEYYNDTDEVNKVCYKFDRHHRYYIFKKNNIDIQQKTKKEETKKGGTKKGGTKKKKNLIDKYVKRKNNILEI